VSISRDQGGSDIDPGPSTRTEFSGAIHDRRMAIHNRMMIQNRRYMRTNLFTDAKAIDELFAAPDTTDREEGKRFTDRYNYDIVNDKPLEGRYEWSPVAEERNTTTPKQHSIDQQQPIRS
jgi:putative lipase involved disintegration of autophagic bodies